MDTRGTEEVDSVGHAHHVYARGKEGRISGWHPGFELAEG